MQWGLMSDREGDRLASIHRRCPCKAIRQLLKDLPGIYDPRRATC